jgi:hypothetical protein
VTAPKITSEVVLEGAIIVADAMHCWHGHTNWNENYPNPLPATEAAVCDL